MITSLSIGRGGLGRMGNQMFTIAGCIGIAVKSGQSYAFPAWLNHDNAIFGQPVDDIGAHLANDWPLIPEGMTFFDYGYFWGYRDVYLPTGDWTIDAHMQCDRFFSHCMPLIRKTFTFKDEPEQNNDVAIHYRAGDYIDDENAHHPRCSLEYYQQAIAQFPKETSFIIFSDNLDDWIRLMKDDKTDWASASDDNTYIEDFKFMKSCKSFITANSSFSLMAAILGTHPEKKIICPQRWFGKSMPEPYLSNTKDIYPENAIVL